MLSRTLHPATTCNRSEDGQDSWPTTNITSLKSKLLRQCQKPAGWLGRVILRNMNSRHSAVTDWGLKHVSIGNHDTILDVGCGGGKTIHKLAAIATEGKVYGIDHSEDSVATSTGVNKQWIETGRVEIRQASVSHLPFAAEMFDLVTAAKSIFARASSATPPRTIHSQTGTRFRVSSRIASTVSLARRAFPKLFRPDSVCRFAPEKHPSCRVPDAALA